MKNTRTYSNFKVVDLIHFHRYLMSITICEGDASASISYELLDQGFTNMLFASVPEISYVKSDNPIISFHTLAKRPE